MNRLRREVIDRLRREMPDRLRREVADRLRREVPDRLCREVADATRMMAGLGLVGYSGHVSARRADGETFWIQPSDDPRATLAPERLLAVDLHANVVEGDGKPPSETHIHAGVYRARDDVRAVAHLHYDPGTAITLADGPALAPMKNHASRWADGVPVHPDPSHIATERQGDEVAAALGTAYALQLRAHGQVIVAEDVRRLFADAVHFAENVQAFLLAARLGPIRPLTGAEIDAFLATFDRAHHADKLWAYHTSVRGDS